MAKLIAAAYGDALFELAAEGNKLDVLAQEIQGLLTVISQNKELSDLMQHPKILKEEKISVLENIFKGRIDKELMGFLILTLKKDRYADLEKILKYFIKRVKEYKGIGEAKVTSAKPLTDSQKKAIEQKLIQTTSYNTMEMQYFEDESLIGGIIIRIGDRVVDGTIKNRLEKLSRECLDIQI